MREVVEFRVPEENARRFLRPDEGRRIGRDGDVRLLELASDSPRYRQIGDVSRKFRERGDFFYDGWDIRRTYTRGELGTAEIFRLQITAVFEPDGEDCGTQYDESEACTICGAGRKQLSDLRVDLRKAPKTRDIAQTIADDERIVSQRLAGLMVSAGLTGFELRPVRHRARYADDAIDLSRYPSGQELLRQAEGRGLSPSSWAFTVWLNQEEQAGLLIQARLEHAQMMRRREPHRKPLPIWYQLVVASHPLSLAEPTRCGIEPFDDDEEGDYRCPLGHVAGLNLLSEVWVDRSGWDGSDVCVTQQMVGTRRGALVPAPLLLISPKFYGLLVAEKIRGYKAEVAHLV